MTTVIELPVPPIDPELETELLEKRLARTEVLLAEARDDREDALRIVAACRKVIESRDTMIAKLARALVDANVEVLILQESRKKTARALDRVSQVLRGCL